MVRRGYSTIAARGARAVVGAVVARVGVEWAKLGKLALLAVPVAVLPLPLVRPAARVAGDRVVRGRAGGLVGVLAAREAAAAATATTAAIFPAVVMRSQGRAAKLVSGAKH